MVKRPVIYIAGPADMDEAKRVAEKYGATAVSPELSGVFGDGYCEEAKRLLKRCDAVAADVNEARGCDEPDSSAAFVCGYAWGLGIKTYCCLTDTRAMRDKYRGERTKLPDGTLVDEQGRWFESDCLNLMLMASSKVVGGTLEDAVKQAVSDIKGGN